MIIDMNQSEMGSKLSEELSARIKKENLIGLAAQHVIRTKHHDKEKLRFLEGLGLVTLEKKKGNEKVSYLTWGEETGGRGVLSIMT
jgi:hypothetical protein